MPPEPKFHVVEGLVQTALSNDETEFGLNIREHEFDDVIRKWKHIPVFLNHKHGEGAFGWVSHFSKGDKPGELKVTMMINSSIPQGRRAIEGIENNTYTGFSLGNFSRPDPTTGEIKKLIPVEVSICDQGARPGTKIHWFTNGAHKQTLSQFYKQEKMASEIAAKKLELQKQMEELDKQEADAATGTAAQQQQLPPVNPALLAKLARFAPGGDLEAFAQMLEQNDEAVREKQQRELQARMDAFRQSVANIKDSGGFGSDPQQAEEYASRISDVPPQLIDVFAALSGNLTERVAEVKQNQELAKENAAKYESERKKNQELEARLKAQQSYGLSTPAERFPSQPVPPPRAAAPQQEQYQRPAAGIQRVAPPKSAIFDKDPYMSDAPSQPISQQAVFNTLEMLKKVDPHSIPGFM